MLSFLKTNSKIIVSSTLLLCFLLSGIGFAQEVIFKGTINAHKLNLRSGPSRTSDVVVVLEKGERVDVVGKNGGIGSWLEVIYKGEKGYIRNRPRYILLKKAVSVEKKAADLKPKENIAEAKKAAQPDHEAEKKQIQEKIIKQEKMVKAFSEKEMEIIEGLNEIDYALNKARIKVSALSTEMMQLEGKIESLNDDRAKLADEIQISRAYAGKRLNAMYKMNMIGRLDAAGLPSSIFDFFLTQNAMKRILSADFRVLEKQSEDLERFESLEIKLKEEIKAKSELEEQLKDQIRINDKETLKREMILQEIRKKKKLSQAAVESLKNAAIQLDNRIDSLQSGENAQINQSSFAGYKGRLIFPVKGEVISKFGASGSNDYKTFTFQKGIDIKVERGEPVKSVFKGEVKFAQWLKGYGNLMIIDHGDNYYTLYAHVEEIFKQPGEHVETGEVIATAGDTGSIKGLCLHFELRHHGKAVNPMRWLRKGA